MTLLGIDLGSSSVKVSLVDAESGRCLASAFAPKQEAPIMAARPGWAEQDPLDWWAYLTAATSEVVAKAGADGIAAIGISYQMHGLVCVDGDLRPLRPAIIWCDSRAVPYGNKAFSRIGSERCLDRMLNSPGNFTAAKLAWVKENEPDIYRRICKILLPGDWIAARLTGEACTTASGLSEGILWDFKENTPSRDVLDAMGIDESLLAGIVPTFGEQGRLSAEAAAELGLKAGIPVTYRAGDQPNNALSLGVLDPGEVAATAGTSGVVYGVSGKVCHDPLSRVNAFAHVNHSASDPRIGVLLCINGTGILNAWTRRNIAPDGLSYNEMNSLAAGIPAGSEGVCVLPFGNGAERMLGNAIPGCSIHGLDFNRHTRAHIYRAAQEGIAFSFRYGMDIMAGMGIKVSRIHAGAANMFLSPVFREALAGVTGASIELYDTDGAVGAARGAGIGAGIYKTPGEAFSTLERISTTELSHREEYLKAYDNWLKHIEK